jgi:hypothetical protein
MMGSFVEFHARDERVRLRLASGEELCGTVRQVADDGRWLLLQTETDERLLVNAGRVDWFSLPATSGAE